MRTWPLTTCSLLLSASLALYALGCEARNCWADESPKGFYVSPWKHYRGTDRIWPAILRRAWKEWALAGECAHEHGKRLHRGRCWFYLGWAWQEVWGEVSGDQTRGWT